MFHCPKWDEFWKLCDCLPELGGETVDLFSPCEFGGEPRSGQQAAVGGPALPAENHFSGEELPTWAGEDEVLEVSEPTFLNLTVSPSAFPNSPVDALSATQQREQAYRPPKIINAEQSQWQDVLLSQASRSMDHVLSSADYDWVLESLGFPRQEQHNPLPSSYQPVMVQAIPPLESLSHETPKMAGQESDSSQTPTGTTTCCGQLFSDVTDLRTHHSIHHGKHHHCGKIGCNESFTQVRSLRRHVKTRHSGVKTVFCPHADCEFASRGFNRKDSYLKHYRRKHMMHGQDGI